ncbi:amino acid adenylation domain-containing protein, partial [Nonomuraea lactucae]|uniref:amino acid adenylation domain-containing protein n=1 Tax=Nonomuraea lactucae TaxID=2249762 RepID=UPI0023DD549E
MAGALWRVGVRRGMRVGLFVERGVDFVVAMLGVVQVGACYVPLDVGWPESRVRFVVEDSQVAVVVCGGGRRLDGFGVVVVDLGEVGGEVCGEVGGEVCGVDAGWGAGVGDDALYVMYTSGSSGVPKGVEVSQRGVVRLCVDAGVRVEPGDVVAQLAPVTFDASTFEIWGALSCGARLAVASGDGVVDVVGFVGEFGVSVLHLTAGLFHQVVESSLEVFEGLRLLLAGGDALSGAHCEVVRERFPGLVFVACYGPTEGTTFSSVFGFGSGDVGGGVVPIGRPLVGTRVVVVDEWLNVVPVGVPGELLIGGAGLAWGYVGRADLTAERFVADPFVGGGGRLYRTGDRVRWRGDGVLEFLGRVDDQVKIRGFRVEPGEVEVVLAGHPEVRDAVVVAREDGPSGKRLVAYVTSRLGEEEPAGLGAFLRERLPEFMVPAVFVVVDGLPLTVNGKVDRRALPDPGVSVAGVEYVPPRTRVEVVLAEIWSQVLGVERVGVRDNFFDLGGDSILSLQIVAGARAAGLRVEVADVFARQSVAELGQVVGDVSVVVAEQAVVSGVVPLTAVQRWLIGRGAAGVGWCRTGVFELTVGADAGLLAGAVEALVAHHDALRMRVAFDAERGEWLQHILASEVSSGLFSVVDAACMDDAELAVLVDEEMAAARGSVNLADGPVLRVVLFDRGERSAWLGVVVHGLVVDERSWEILLEDLSRVCAGDGLPEKTTSFKQWAERVVEEGPYTQPPVDSGADEVVRVWLGADESAAVLSGVHGAYRTLVGDVLAAALVQSLGGEVGAGGVVTVGVEGHGREVVAEGMDLSRTVGRFTSIRPIMLSSQNLGDPAGVLKSVKEQLRHPTDLDDMSEPDVLLTWSSGGESAGVMARKVLEEVPGRSCAVEIRAVRAGDGRVGLEWRFDPGLYRAESVQGMADAHVRALRGLIAHCLSPGAGGFTPSDFPLAGLDQVGVDRLVAGAAVADVYRLTPVQQGMLFHTLEAPAGSGVYVAQGLHELAGRRLDVAALRRAWDVVVGRHAALRTGFVWEGVPEPVQVVHEAVQVPFEVLDWSHADAEMQQARYEELVVADRERGFDVSVPPLMRVHLVDRGGDRYWLVWTMHHLTIDGWSLPIVLDEVLRAYEGLCDEVLRAYEGLCRGGRVELPAVRPFRDFVAWLAERDAVEAEEFWRSYLAGFEAATPLPVDRQATRHWDQDRRRLELSREVTAGLVRLARRARVTLGTVVQAGWALLLSRYSGERDVVFGLTVSGRPVELAGMESMVGLFINTLPVRARVPADVPFIDWLRELQDGQIALQRFEHSALADIQRCSEVPRGSSLFDSIMVFAGSAQGEHPHNGDTIENSFGLGSEESFEQGHYPLLFAVDFEERLLVQVEFSTAAFDGATVERLLGQFEWVLRVVAGGGGVLVRDVGLGELVSGWGMGGVVSGEVVGVHR